MALEGIPGATPAFRTFVSDVRLFMRDHPQLNRLIAGEESSDRMIAWAVLDALSDFNGTPPQTGFTLDELLMQNQHALLRRMTVIALVESIGLLQTRNHLNYSTGGTNVGVNDKTPLLMNWLQYFRNYTDQMKGRVKVAMNIMSIIGPSNVGMHSEYWSINSSYQVFLLLLYIPPICVYSAAYDPRTADQATTRRRICRCRHRTKAGYSLRRGSRAYAQNGASPI